MHWSDFDYWKRCLCTMRRLWTVSYRRTLRYLDWNCGWWLGSLLELYLFSYSSFYHSVSPLLAAALPPKKANSTVLSILSLPQLSPRKSKRLSTMTPPKITAPLSFRCVFLLVVVPIFTLKISVTYSDFRLLAVSFLCVLIYG